MADTEWHEKVAWEEEPSTEGLLPSDWPMNRYVGTFLINGWCGMVHPLDS